MLFVQRLNAFVAKIESWILVAIVLLMVTMSFLQIILRAFSIGILWGDIFLRHLVLWVGFIGASLATREEKHINIDVLSRLLNEKRKVKLPVVLCIFLQFIFLGC